MTKKVDAELMKLKIMEWMLMIKMEPDKNKL